MKFCRFLPETKPQENAEATYGLLVAGVGVLRNPVHPPRA